MNTNFNIGEKVFVEGTVTNISIQNGEVTYLVEFEDSGTRVSEKNLIKLEPTTKEAYPINQEENCKIICDFIKNVTGVDIREAIKKEQNND